MNVLFVHQNFPAQFGAIASDPCPALRMELHLRHEMEGQDGFHAHGQVPAGGRRDEGVHFLARNFENTARAALGVYQALKKADSTHKPDVIVAHSGFGSTLFLRDLFECPVVNFFEFYYRARHGPACTARRSLRWNPVSSSACVSSMPAFFSICRRRPPATRRPISSGTNFPRNTCRKSKRSSTESIPSVSSDWRDSRGSSRAGPSPTT